MPTIDVYATGHRLTFLPSERAERIVLECRDWWEHRIDYVTDRVVMRGSTLGLSPRYVLNHCRQIASEKPGERWARKEGA